MRHVRLDSASGHGQQAGNVGLRTSFGHQAEHPHLGRGQRAPAEGGPGPGNGGRPGSGAFCQPGPGNGGRPGAEVGDCGGAGLDPARGLRGEAGGTQLGVAGDRFAEQAARFVVTAGAGEADSRFEGSPARR